MQITRIGMYAEYIQPIGNQEGMGTEKEKEKEIGNGWGLFVEIDDIPPSQSSKKSKYMNRRIRYYSGNIDTIYEENHDEVSIDIDLEDEIHTRNIYKFNMRNSFCKFIKERILLCGVSCLSVLHGYFFK